jgi:hypothetical protein
MSGFGRKGTTTGGAGSGGAFAQGSRAPSAIAATSGGLDSDLVTKREAFLTAERARRNPDQPEVNGDALPASHRPARPRPERSMIMAYVWWFILAQISAHRFYLGATNSAIAQVCMFVGWVALILIGPPATFLGLAVMGLWILWILADAFLIPGLHRKYTEDAGKVTQIFS